MKKNLLIKLTTCLLALSLILVSAAQAQVTTTRKKFQSDTSIHLKVYYQSVTIGDLNMAISALHYLVASDPTRYRNWQDTLALLYVRNNEFKQAHLLSDALMNEEGYTDLRMEIKAVCAKALQQPVEAIDAYSQLYNKTNKTVYGFEELRLQYSIKRLSETIMTGNSLLQKITPADKDFVSVVRTDGKTSQQVSLKAAICNLLGLAYTDLKDNANAIAQFEMALKENPEFDLAKNNLAAAQPIADSAKK